MFELESIIIGVEANVNAGELIKLDYEEQEEILSDEERRAKWDWELSHGIIDVADILLQKDPDRFPDRETAQDYLFERSSQDLAEDDEETTPNGSLLEALTRPVG